MTTEYEEGFNKAIALVIETTQEAGFFFIDDEEREEYIDLIKSIKCPSESSVRDMAKALERFGARSRPR
jgi:hypothetical protein